MEEKIKLKFFIEYGAGCLWPANELARDKFGVGCLNETIYDLDGNITQEPAIKLPVNLEATSRELVELYYERLDQNDPGGQGLWNNAQLSTFHRLTKKLYIEISDYLGPDIELEYKQE
jgi:hypothetical protein